MPGWVYIMTSKPDGVLDIGVTAYLAACIHQHRTDKCAEFCHRYGLHRPVYAKEHGRIEDAIAREKAMKAWKREWKIGLIESINPAWDDLFDRLA